MKCSCNLPTQCPRDAIPDHPARMCEAHLAERGTVVIEPGIDYPLYGPAVPPATA